MKAGQLKNFDDIFNRGKPLPVQALLSVGALGTYNTIDLIWGTKNMVVLEIINTLSTWSTN